MIDKDFEQRSAASIRRKITDLLLGSSSVRQLEQLYLGDAGVKYKVLLRRLVVEIPCGKQEKLFATRLRERLRSTGKDAFEVGVLMAAMLYNRAYDMPFMPDLQRIPEFFLEDFLQYMTNPVLLFLEQGEENRFVAYMEQWIDFLHRHITTEYNSLLWRRVGNHFVKKSDFGPLYFNDRNLKALYMKRGDIVEYLLRSNGYNTDYGFTANAHGKDNKIRIGILANHYMPHPETFATLPVYEYLDREFIVILYAIQSMECKTQEYCSSRAHELKVLPPRLDLQVKAIREDDLDILFIATNVTSIVNQVCLLATHRLARRQIAGVGSVTTTGLRNVDYYLTGKLTDDAENAIQYRESLRWVTGPAHCFSYCESEQTGAREIKRQELGIDEDAIIYMSGSNMYKILPELENVWAEKIN